ncbi:MAG: 16S rRNA (cytosine(1402)-N(4))-methyltransferase RsmH [Planctomycetota bacterium]|nr:16S rRNA (cytosine(1402)-N(4))-methyltransferase RsmH [Planctomycetota bacterium]
MAESDPPPQHRRRPRYRGTHPRRFEEKYKELDAERYPELVEHVKSRGQTPAGQHVPILVEETLEVLAPAPGERGVDCTFGFGGHSARFLERLRPGGQLLALDVDPLQLPRTEARLRALGHGEDALLVRRTNFAALASTLHEVGWSDGVDFLFADLGVSSMQIDDPARGFTFKLDGPLDMRMNPARGLSAAQWLERADEARLVRALQDDSDEPHAERIARALLAARGTLRTTLELAQAVRRALPPRLEAEEAERSVRRVFQALRIEVNDEFGVLDSLLRQVPGALRPGGRVALLTFHSGEDRRVKRAFEQGLASGEFEEISDAVLRPSPEERRANPRSAPAKLRWARRTRQND